MSNSKSFFLNWTKANSVFPLETLLAQDTQNILSAKSMLLSKTGKSPEFTDWISFMREHALTTIERQKSFVEKISAKSDAFVVIGIGGSLLGTKAVYEALTHSFSQSNPKKLSGKPLLFWAGHHVAQEELIELCEALDFYSPSLVVISKSGGTTEPALAFRILKEYLEQRFGKVETAQRIFAITDPNNGTLLSLAKEHRYPYFPIPEGVGGRYSIFTSVGLLPLALAGINVTEFVQGGIDALENCTYQDNNSLNNNPALCYAAIRNILYKNNYKIEALCSWTPKAKGIAEWWKQLFGESDGKQETGIFPASANFTTDLHSLGQYFQEGERHLFATHLKFMSEVSHTKKTQKIMIPRSDLKDGFEFLENKELSYVQQQAQAGTFLAHADGKVPTLVWEIPELNAYWLGFWMFTNMFACAVGNYARGINPFDQPGVEAYKNNMFALMEKKGFEQKSEEIKSKMSSSRKLVSSYSCIEK